MGRAEEKPKGHFDVHQLEVFDHLSAHGSDGWRSLLALHSLHHGGRGKPGSFDLGGRGEAVWGLSSKALISWDTRHGSGFGMP